MHRHSIEVRMRHDCSTIEKPLNRTRNILIDGRPQDHVLVYAVNGDVYGIEVIVRVGLSFLDK
jgi:hypothetical protein